MRLAVGTGEDPEVPGAVSGAWFFRGFFRRTSSAVFSAEEDLDVVREGGGTEDGEPARAWKSLYLFFSRSSGLTCFLMPRR